MHLLFWEILFDTAIQYLVPKSSSILPPTTKVPFIERICVQKNRQYTELFEEIFFLDRKQLGLIGEAGTGKSALAVETGKRLERNHNIKFLWSSARDREDYSHISLLEDILNQLKIYDNSITRSSLISTISKGKYFLVLDNFETIGKEGQKQCLTWIKNIAPCSTLITSLSMIKGISNISIESMTAEEAKSFVKNLKDDAINPIRYSEEEISAELKTTNPLLIETAIEILDTKFDTQVSLTEVLSVVKNRIERITKILDIEGNVVFQTLLLFPTSTTKNILFKATGLTTEIELNKGLSELKQCGLLVEEGNKISLKESQKRLFEISNINGSQ
jgi:hypothetical protein